MHIKKIKPSDIYKYFRYSFFLLVRKFIAKFILLAFKNDGIQNNEKEKKKNIKTQSKLELTISLDTKENKRKDNIHEILNGNIHKKILNLFFIFDGRKKFFTFVEKGSKKPNIDIVVPPE
ncbi:MAG: hypothetical protein RR201_03220 [Malacoplasma sp.]